MRCQNQSSSKPSGTKGVGDKCHKKQRYGGRHILAVAPRLHVYDEQRQGERGSPFGRHRTLSTSTKRCRAALINAINRTCFQYMLNYLNIFNPETIHATDMKSLELTTFHNMMTCVFSGSVFVVGKK